ncbi:nSTAND3 domain-containing NTPase [Streptomyces kanasensis]|uniref:nSTAND3 domain-containing NTPase n=1 Tax=Streptomyces kanasensis TaxID=936756 RepID=UPI00380746A1
MSDLDDAPQQDERDQQDQRDGRPPAGDHARDPGRDPGRDRDGAGRDGAGRDGADAAPAPEPPPPNPFDHAGRNPLGASGGTGGAGTAHAARTTFEHGRAERRYDIRGDGQVFEDNTFINQFWVDSGPPAVQGAVPRETLAHLAAVYCETTGYQRMKQTLRANGLIVLAGEPGSGRTATALALLSELTEDQVTRLDPATAVHTIGDDALHAAHGYLLELPPEDSAAPEPDGPDGPHGRHPARRRLTELHLDRFSGQLRARTSYGIVLVESGDLADRLLQGRYGVTCPPPSPAEVLHRHLRILLRGEPQGALDAACALAAHEDVVGALGLDELRPREAARLADHLARHQKGELTHEQLVEDCGAFVRAQARVWFARADRPGRLPEALPALNAAAFRIAVAVFNGSAYSLTAEAAELLTWELAVTLDPEHPVGRRLFGTHADNRPAVARSVVEDGELDLGAARVPARVIRFQGDALATAVLREVWHGHHNVRGPVSRWLRGLCDDPRPEVWVRASIAAGVLCSWDWVYGFGELVRPLAALDGRVPRMAAATALAEAARDPRVQPAVAAVLREWARSGDAALVDTAVLAHGYVLPAGSVRSSLDALGAVVRADDGADPDVLGTASFSVMRLLASSGPDTVVDRLGRWLDDGRRPLADLVLLSAIGALTMRTTHLWGLTEVPALETYGSRPLLLALLATRPDLAAPLAALVREALGTPRSGEPALDGLAALLRRAARDPETLRDVCGFLPRLAATSRDRDRLRGLLTGLVRDRDKPLDKAAAGRMWDAVAEGGRR